VLAYQPIIAEALALMGNVLLRSGHAQEAERSLVDAYLAADGSRHDEVRAEVAENLVYVLGYQQARFEDSRRWAKIAEAVMQRLGGHDLLRAWLLNDVGALYTAEGDHESAARVMQQSLEIKEKVLGRDHPDVGRSEGNVAIALAELGRRDEALIHIQRALSVMERGLGATHPDLSTHLGNKGEILESLGRYLEARQSFERARTIAENELGPDDRGLAEILTGLGITYLAEGKPANAIVPLERAVKIYARQEASPPKSADAAFALARALWDTSRDKGRARALAEEARATYARGAAKDKLARIQDWLGTRG